MTGSRHFPCKQCGADLSFDPGVASLKCEHCGAENEMPKADAAIEELDFATYLAKAHDEEATHERLEVKCNSCAAQWTFDPDVFSGQCPFCGANVVAESISRRVIKPRSLLPFRITREQAHNAYSAWLRGLWFAPNKLKEFARMDGGIKGVYVPYWTYDCRATSSYTGQRGDDYWATETYTTVVNGRPVMRTRQVRRTRWTSVSGVVMDRFDDILVLASESLPRSYTESLEPWDLEDLVPYSDEYISGFRAESYQVTLAEGFDRARDIMAPTIKQTICRDIGGDHQQITSVHSSYDHITFKHLLLPIWLCAYQYRNTAYRVLINARTGEVQGSRPYSAAKIALLALSIIAVILVIVAIVAAQHRHW